MSEEKKVRGIFEKNPGSGIWWIRFTDASGQYRREKIGSKSAAIKLYHKRKAEALEGVKLPARLRRRVVPFTEIADDAVTYIEKKYSRPSDDMARMKVVKLWFDGIAADALSPDAIEAKLDSIQAEKKWSASSRNHHHNLISLAYRLALRSGKVKTSPIHGKLRKATEDNGRVRFLTPDEEKELREVLQLRPEWATHLPELDLAMHTGLRRSSMYRDLTWESVDVSSRVAIIPRTKNGEAVTISLNDVALRALAIFRERGDGRGRVVRSADGEYLGTNAHWFVEAAKQAGIPNFHWHDLRHTYASRLRQAGVPLGNIAELLGHKGLAMTRRYAHLSISNLHEAVAALVSKTNSTSIAPEPISVPREASYVN